MKIYLSEYTSPVLKTGKVCKSAYAKIKGNVWVDPNDKSQEAVTFSLKKYHPDASMPYLQMLNKVPIKIRDDPSPMKMP